MAQTDQQVSGSTEVNPSPNPPKIKDSAIHLKELGTKNIKDAASTESGYDKSVNNAPQDAHERNANS